MCLIKGVELTFTNEYKFSNYKSSKLYLVKKVYLWYYIWELNIDMRRCGLKSCELSR